ncbi:MAG TPA: putative inorganic carbon transporter subunit DabA [Nannocystaceae bacterium]|nr:putative inorganic carbon transporter subunit DabA [Nannocystaceae bacterium]
MPAHEAIDTDDPAERQAREWIDRIARWLPEQRPLSVFVHTNPMEALEHEHFHKVCEAATRIRGARSTMTYERYRRLLAERQIRAEDVASALKRLQARNLDKLDDLPAPKPGTILISTVRPEMAIEIGPLVDSFLIRVLPAFLDLGSAIWPMPGRERGLLGTVRWLASTPLGVPEPWLSGLRARLGTDTPAMKLVLDCLAKRGDRETGWPHVIHEALFALPGYAGMIHRLEHLPHERPKGVDVKLIDYLAVRLVIEELALTDVAHGLYGRKATLATLASTLGSLDCAHPSVPWSIELGAFQDAFEEEYIRSFIGGIVMAQEMARDKLPERVDVQLLVCIDDRCESIRRHIEEVIPNAVTYGSAGFFGVALKHRAPLDCDENPSCPAPVTPTKRVTEKLSAVQESALLRKRRWRRALGSTLGDDASRGPLGGLVASFVNFARAPKALVHLLFPWLFVGPAHDYEGTQLLYDTSVEPEGFTLEDRIALVEGNLRLVGLIRDFAPFVLIVAHGSMATNNQFNSGYQCGACGGRRGGINARVFCAHAGLSARGIVIPEATLFVPGEHDTALDWMRWFDLEHIAGDRRRELGRIFARLEIALERNAKERSRRFADIPLDEPLPDTVARVRARCADFAETRPEYNHATNAACIIGRRTLTRGLFLDRRPFMVSYDATTDDDQGTLLQKLMGAPLPVCAGISLEYFFSTMDPVVFGSGTKLPHNVVGLLGVSNGADGDLQPGLWRQTTELHDPIRLVTLVESEPEIVTRVLERLPAVKNTVENHWIHLFACSPSGRGFFRWVDDGFQPYAAVPHILFEVGSSLEACGHTRDHVAPCLIVKKGTRRDLEAAE